MLTCACWLIGAYFLAVSSHKRGRLNTSVYSSQDLAVAVHGEWLSTVGLKCPTQNVWAVCHHPAMHTHLIGISISMTTILIVWLHDL